MRDGACAASERYVGEGGRIGGGVTERSSRIALGALGGDPVSGDGLVPAGGIRP